MEYRRLRAEYDVAFGKLCAEVSGLRSIIREPRPDKTAEKAARRRIEQAMNVYRETRDNLSRFLTSGRQPVVRALAYRLWEEAGRPIGNSQEHWYRAEELLRSER